MKDGGGVVRRRAAQRTLVSAQIAASFVLLYATMLIFTAFQRVLSFHDAPNPRTLVTASVRARGTGFDTARARFFRRELLSRLSPDPDVAGVVLSNPIPPFQWSGSAPVFRLGEEPPPSG